MTDSPATDRTDAPLSEPTPAGPIIARAGTYYRNMRYLMVALMLGAAGWFGYDGLVRYPAQNQRYDDLAMQQKVAAESGNELRRAEVSDALRKHGAKHSDTDLATQKYLMMGLPVVAIAYTIFFLNRSRGEYRLEGDTLHAPGHPPVPVATITAVDDELWKRKGISQIDYAGDGKKSTITLDDFIYDADPVRKIHDTILAARPSLKKDE